MTTSLVTTGLKNSVRADVTPEFLSNRARLENLHRHEASISPALNISPLQRVISEAMRRWKMGIFKSPFEYDAWLAPRVHYVLRLTRRQASTMEIWLRLALVDFPEYVRSRWENVDGTVSRYRFTGEPQPLRRSALARLWWAAENGRNGVDYSPAVWCLSDSGRDQYIFDLRYSHYRPAVVAIVEALKQSPLTFDQMKRFSTALNVALGARCLEALGPEWQEIEDPHWLAADVDANQAIQADVQSLVGPNAGRVSKDAYGELCDWIAEIATVARES